jgi:hypothetical protein
MCEEQVGDWAQLLAFVAPWVIFLIVIWWAER